MKVVLVDDERIVIEHIKHLIPWEQYGFEIAASATNGKSALRLCEELRPQIMMIDIRMPVMDGLELIRAANEKELGIKWIVMSAYEDFDYARQAISLGHVISYLVKHEVDAGKLLSELNKAKAAWESDEKQRRSARNEQIKQLVTGTGTDLDRRSAERLFGATKPPYWLVLIQQDKPFTAVPPGAVVPTQDQPRAAGWTHEDITKLFCAYPSSWQLIGEFPADGGGFAALFAPKNKSSLSSLASSFRSLLADLQSEARRKHDCAMSMFYAHHIEDASSLAGTFHRMSAAARHAVFCGREAIINIEEAPLPAAGPDSFTVRTGSYKELIESLNHNRRDEVENAISGLFEQALNPSWNLRVLYELVGGLTALMNERLAMKGLVAADPFDPEQYGLVYHVVDIRERFILLFSGLCADVKEPRRLPFKLQKALRFIQEHFHEEISIEDVSHATGVSASYLHQLFKRELDRTFLDYLTDTRIHQAKKILRQEDIKITEVAARVGYRSSQHFSQLFKKTTGTLPHQYRDGGYSS